MKKLIIFLTFCLCMWAGGAWGTEIKPICVWYQGMPSFINPNETIIVSNWYQGIPTLDYFDITSTSQASMEESLFPIMPIFFKREVQGDGIK